MSLVINRYNGPLATHEMEKPSMQGRVAAAMWRSIDHHDRWINIKQGKQSIDATSRSAQ